MKRLAYAALGVALGVLVRAYLGTLRVSLVVDCALDPRDPRPWVLCFWHGDQFPLLAWRRRRATVALVSHSLDGALQARALRVQGLAVERGSSSRGGARGLASVVRRLRRSHDAAFALDGPRGPRFGVAPGAAAAARFAGGLLVPMGSASPHGVTLMRAWDRFRIPWPFTRVGVCLGSPLPATASDEELRDAVMRASALASEAARMVASPKNALLRHAPGA